MASLAPPPVRSEPSPAGGNADIASAKFLTPEIAEIRGVDLNELTDGGTSYDAAAQTPAPPPQTGFQEFDFTTPVEDAGAREQATGASVERMLKQELESVEFYIEQGYAYVHADVRGRRHVARLARQQQEHEQHGADEQPPRALPGRRWISEVHRRWRSIVGETLPGTCTSVKRSASGKSSQNTSRQRSPPRMPVSQSWTRATLTALLCVSP